MLNLVALSLLVSVAPALLHLGALGGAVVRPPLSRQKSSAERFLFRNIRLIWALNGVLLGAFVFLWHQDNELAWVALIISLPTIVAQTVGLVLAKYWDVHEGGKQQQRR